MGFLFVGWMPITPFAAVVKDLFAAVGEKNGGKLTPDQISRVSLKLGEMLGNPDSHEVTQNEKGQVCHAFFPLPPPICVECGVGRKLTLVVPARF